MQTELTADPAFTSSADLIASRWLTSDIYKEVKAQGFPGYMCYSFMQTARTANSVILSRLPGGVGLDLIEKGYDLKGFHIKAKSCNWGPMAGFICRLPVFNKLGIDKAEFNAKEVVHYLKHLKNFSGSKIAIKKATATRDSDIAKLATTLSEADRKKETEKINAICDDIVVKILLAEREKEEIEGEWSGENAIETEYPFIALKREFDVAKLSEIRGIKFSLEIDETTWYGVAENVTNEDGGENKPTVITEFLLKKDTSKDYDKNGKEIANKRWKIYHGRIKYKTSDAPTAPFDVNFGGQVLDAKFKTDYLEKNRETLKTIFAFEEKEKLVYSDGPDLAKFLYSEGGVNVFAPPAGSATFYVVQGFVNPFPPYKLQPPPAEGATPIKDEYYKNAVSGDYDLFANWPKMSVNQDELIRHSEIATGAVNRIGGKIFTTYVGNHNNFGIEFVPGFGELNAKPGSKLKESAEFGNMNSLCHLVSGLINNNAAYFLKEVSQSEEVSQNTSDGNKGFHSDEGGRPGIMEIEFPIAVFLPKKMETAALNNVADSTGVITSTLARRAEYLGGGLLKSAEELVMFILECMQADFRIFMHYRWMVHLLYNAVDTTENAVIKLKAAIEKNRAAIIKDDDKFTDEGGLKEFKAIDANKAIIDKHMAPYKPLYIDNLKKILKCYKDDSGLFNEITNLFFDFYYLPNMPSFDKRTALEGLMNKTEVKAATPVTPA